jgi:hypothetical protein
MVPANYTATGTADSHSASNPRFRTLFFSVAYKPLNEIALVLLLAVEL